MCFFPQQLVIASDRVVISLSRGSWFLLGLGHLQVGEQVRLVPGLLGQPPVCRKGLRTALLKGASPVVQAHCSRWPSRWLLLWDNGAGVAQRGITR